MTRVKSKIQISAMKLKNYRKRHGMSQADLAIKLGVSRALVSHLETNRCGFDLEFINRIALKLMLPIEEITEERIDWNNEI